MVTSYKRRWSQLPDLYVMVALPRAGKSTYIKNNLQGLVQVSADQLRLLISGRRFSKKDEPKVWWVRNIMLEILMQQGMDIVVDQTNINRERRRPLLELAKKYDYRTIAVEIKTDLKICKKRAIETEQEDLLPVIERMAQYYEKVKKDEGFNEIVYYDNI